MKVKQIIKVAEAIDDSRKMPCDMHELEDTKYFSHSKQDFIAIADMDIVHLVRAFKNDRHRLANQLTDKDLIRQNEDGFPQFVLTKPRHVDVKVEVSADEEGNYGGVLFLSEMEG